VRQHIVLISLLAVLIALTIWITSIGKLGIYNTFTYPQVLQAALSHLEMVFSAVILATVVGIPLGVLATRSSFRRLAPLIVGGANIGQTIPSLALIAIMAPLLGFGLQSAIVALFIYGLLPIVRNSYTGVSNIDPSIIEAARGMGMTQRQIMTQVELPLALPVIMAGIRISTILTVGTAELAVLVGGAGLGKITLTGVFAREALLILQGAAPTAAMAIVLGFALAQMESWMTPRGNKAEALAL